MESIYVHVCVCVFENANSMNIFFPKILYKCQVQPDICLLQNLQNIAWTKRLVEKFCLQQLCRNAQLSVFMWSVIHKLYIFFLNMYIHIKLITVMQFFYKMDSEFFSKRVCVCRIIVIYVPLNLCVNNESKTDLPNANQRT